MTYGFFFVARSVLGVFDEIFPKKEQFEAVNRETTDSTNSNSVSRNFYFLVFRNVDREPLCLRQSLGRSVL